MHILLISPEERRNRYRFLEIPLLRGEHRVDVVKTNPLKIYLSNTLNNVQNAPKPDLMIIVGIGVRSLAAFLIARYSRIPVLARLGGDPVKDKLASARSSFEKGEYLNWLTHKTNIILARMLVRKFDGILTVSRSLAKRISEETKASLPIMVVPQYCEVSRRERNYAIDDTLELLTVTNLLFREKAKGAIWLIQQVIKYATTTDTRIIYRIAGGGVHFADVSAYVSSLDKPHNLEIVLEGFVQDIESMYIQADIFLYYSEHDELPNTILEAKRYGMPMMVNSCEQFRSVVTDGLSGMLYKNKIEFLQQLAELASDKYRRKTLGTAAKKELDEQYSISAIQQLLEKELEGFLVSTK